MRDIERLSLGHTVLNANNLEGRPVVTGNYVGPNYELPLPGPLGDWYLRQTFVPAIRSGETVICHSLIDGLLGYYRKIGLIPEDAEIIQIEPSRNGNVRYGFPVTDPLEILRGQVMFKNDDSRSLYLSSVFTSAEVNKQAEDLGLSTIKRAESRFTNHKARLREASSRYGFQMLPGRVLQNWSDLQDVTSENWNTDQGVWLKFPTGSGGDLVYKVPKKATFDMLRGGVRALRQNVGQSFSEGHFGISIDDFWPDNLLSPQDYPLVLEADVQLLGEVVTNGSTQLIAKKNRAIDIIGHFTQITTEAGEYLGNEPYVGISEEAKELAEFQTNLVAKYNIIEHGYYGIQGVDWFLTRNGSNRMQVSVVELNSRPTANTPPVIIAEKLNAPHWINTNVYTDRLIRNINDYIATVGTDYAYGTPTDSGMVVPQSFRTLVRRGEVEPSPNFKVIILGRDSGHCRQITKALTQRGIRFNP